jgi:hypothetical protein
MHFKKAHQKNGELFLFVICFFSFSIFPFQLRRNQTIEKERPEDRHKRCLEKKRSAVVPLFIIS